MSHYKLATIVVRPVVSQEIEQDERLVLGKVNLPAAPCPSNGTRISCMRLLAGLIIGPSLLPDVDFTSVDKLYLD